MTEAEAENVYGTSVMLETLAKVTKCDTTVFKQFWDEGEGVKDSFDNARQLLIKLVEGKDTHGFNYKSPWTRAIYEQA